MIGPERRNKLFQTGPVKGRLACLLSFAFGLRSNELARLQWSDLDLDAGTIRLARGKGSKPVQSIIPPAVKRALETWRIMLEDEYGSPDLPPNVLHTRTGRPYHRARIHTLIREHAAAVGVALPPQLYNPLRAELAEALEAQGFGLQQIAAALGHRNVSTTDHYLRSRPPSSDAVQLLIDLT